MSTKLLPTVGLKGIGSLFVAVLLTVWAVPTAAQEEEDERDAPQEHLRELKQKLTELQAELKELESAGKEDRAAEVRKQAEKIKRALAARQPQPDKLSPKKLGRTPPMEREIARGPEAKRAEMEKRHEHLRIAVENLHAAGLPDLAEHVGREGKRIFLGQREFGPGPEALPRRPGLMLEELRNELRELREVVHNMGRRIDELARQAAELREREDDDAH